MRVRCFLRDIRGRRSLRDLEASSGVNRGDLSKFERGVAFPLDKDVPAIEEAYGRPLVDWYGDDATGRALLLALQPDPEEE